jgi:AraC-like DNA-binding protein
MPGHLPHAHTVLATVIANAFEELRVAVALYVPGEWYPIHVVTGVDAFELEFGVAERRQPYNYSCFDRVKRDGAAVLSAHAGFNDLFVPVGDRDNTWGILATGPFATARPTSGDLLERWHWLTGTHARMSDPSFCRYVAATLATLTLEGDLLGTFRRLMSCFAALLAGQGAAAQLGADGAAARIELANARFVERMWEAADTMVDERSSHIWLNQSRTNALAFLGMAELPEHVVAGLLVGPVDDPDPIGESLRRDAFQRASVGLARKIGGVVCARVGDHGVAFLVDEAGSGRGAKLLHVAERAAALARSHGFRLHVGVGEASDRAPLALKYRAALAAAEQALSLGRSVVRAGRAASKGNEPLRALRQRLAQVVAEPFGLLAPRFDRYLEAVAVHSGYRLEPARTHLEAGLERVADTLASAGLLSAKSIEDMHGAMDRASAEAATMRELFSAYRRLVADIDLELRRPTGAYRERGTRRAVEFIREHLGERLTLTNVARVAGFAPSYFSRMFKRQEATTFEAYVRRLRVERAKQLLEGTSLSVERIGQLCGFGTRNYFHRVFKAAQGATPAEYRTRNRGARSLPPG